MAIKLNTDRLKECRMKIGITKQEAARRINVSQPAYLRYEAGIRTPSIQVVNAMADVFNTSAAYLTGETDSDSPDVIIVRRNESPLLYSILEKCDNCNEDQLKRLLKYLNELTR